MPPRLDESTPTLEWPEKPPDRLAEFYHENTKLTAANIWELDTHIQSMAQQDGHLRPCPALRPASETVNLPRRRFCWGLDRLIRRRRTIREFRPGPISLRAVSRILANAAGVTLSPADTGRTIPWPLRATPSAGALYPLELRLAALQIKNLPSGIYRYQPYLHSLERLLDAIPVGRLAQSSLHPQLVEQAALVLAVFADWTRVISKYGDRGYRYTLLEAGHLAQNVLLTCTSLKLAAVPVAGFLDDECATAFGRQTTGCHLVYLILIGGAVTHRPGRVENGRS